MAKYCLECGVKAQDAARACLSCGSSKFRSDALDVVKPATKEPAQITEQEYRKHMMRSADEVTRLIRDYRRFGTIALILVVIGLILSFVGSLLG